MGHLTRLYSTVPNMLGAWMVSVALMYLRSMVLSATGIWRIPLLKVALIFPLSGPVIWNWSPVREMMMVSTLLAELAHLPMNSWPGREQPMRSNARSKVDCTDERSNTDVRDKRTIVLLQKQVG